MVRLGTFMPLNTPISVLIVVEQSASTLLSMEVISGSVQRDEDGIVVADDGKLVGNGNSCRVGEFYCAYRKRIVGGDHSVKFQSLLMER